MTESPPSAAPARIEPDAAFVARARELRPFYFVVVVWGERYVDFLLNFCIASLLSPGNIPALANRGKNKFLIATTREDWSRMQGRANFKRLAEYVEPVMVPIPTCPPDVSGCVHMGIGHKLATQMAFEARAYSVLLTPDLMLSDGTMAEVQRHAVDGMQVVLTAALRFGEEPLFENLARIGVARAEDHTRDDAHALVVTGRQLVWAGIRSFHSETARYEWEAPWFSTFPVACWWRVPGEDGIVVHSLSWAPLLVDYDAIQHHDSSMMDYWTIDGDYVYRNFGLNGRVHIEQDSDRIMLVSWAPLSDREQSLEPRRWQSHPNVGFWAKGLVLHETFHNEAVFDPLKQRIFSMPVFWHARDLSPPWDEVERKAQRVLGTFAPPPGLVSHGVSRGILRTIYGARWALRAAMFVSRYALRLLQLIGYYWDGKTRVLGVAMNALRGDKAAIERIRRHLKYLSRQLFGRPA